MAATFTVEDGTGLAAANAYCTVEFADQYHEDNGNPAAWSSLSEADKQKHIRLGARYLDAVYAHRLPGERTSATQRLEWPRLWASDRDGHALADDEVPTSWQEGNAVAALKSAEAEADGTSLLADIDEPGSLKRERVKLDVIEVEEEWIGGKSQTAEYPEIDAAIARVVLAAGRLRRG